jgi:signal transduction histidine kinase
VLTVHDTGIGIAAEHLPYLFERFYRVDPARSSAGGAGLGLAISKSIAEEHGGRIHVASQPGAGSTFTVTLPRAPAGANLSRPPVGGRT